MSLLSNIKLAMENTNYTLASLEKEIGLGNGTIRKWDNNSPSCDKVVKVANLLNVSIDWLLSDTNNIIISMPLNINESILINYFRRLSPVEQGVLLGNLEMKTNSGSTFLNCPKNKSLN